MSIRRSTQFAMKSPPSSKVWKSRWIQQAPQCSLSDLVADARAQAQKMASAAGATAGVKFALSG